MDTLRKSGGEKVKYKFNELYTFDKFYAYSKERKKRIQLLSM